MNRNDSQITAAGLDTARHNMRCALALARGLTGGLPTVVVVSPGSRSTPLTLAFDALPEVDLQVVLDERAAAFVALGVARASGKPAIALCTSGSAGAHYGPACVEAAQGRLPLILISANRPPELQHCGAPQTIPQDRLLPEPLRLRAQLPVACAAVSDNWLRQFAAQARAAACGSPSGPIHLDVPFREPLWLPELTAELAEWLRDAPPVQAIARDDRPAPALPSAASLDAAAARLRRCRGAIVCGPQLAGDSRAIGQAAARLAAELGWPLLREATSAALDASQPADLVEVRRGDALLRCAPFRAWAERAEVVLLLGQTPTSKPLRQWLASLPERGVAIDPDGWWTDPSGCVAEQLSGDVPQILAALQQRLGRNTAAGEHAWLAGWRGAEASARAVSDEHAAQGVWEGRLARQLSQALPADATLFVGSSMPIRDLNDFGATRPLTTFANRGCNGIDGGVATAAGVALANRDRPTVAWLGDLALLHDLDGLEAAGAAGWPLTLVIANNGGGGIFDQLPIAAHPSAHERLFVTPRVARLGPLCAALGASHRQVELTDDGLARALAQASAEGGLQLLEVQIDRRESLARRQAAWQAVDAVLRRSVGSWRATGSAPAPRPGPVQADTVAAATRLSLGAGS